MTTVPLAFLISLVLALAITPVVIRLARRVDAVDDGGASSRKVHGRAIPRLGGVAIVIAFYAPLVLLLFVDSSIGRMYSEDLGMALGLLVVAVVFATTVAGWLFASSFRPLANARALANKFAYRRRLVARAGQARARLETANSLGEVWDAAVLASAPLEPTAMYLFAVDLGDDCPDHKQLCVWRSREITAAPSFSAAYPIDMSENRVALFELYWSGDRTALSDAEHAHLNLLVDRLEQPLRQHTPEATGADVVVLRTTPYST